MKMTQEELKLAKRRIKDRNRRFEEMPPNRKRIAIARDVIKMLQEGGLKARSGTYLSVPKDLRVKLYDDIDSDDKQLQEIFCETTCTVCGIGAAFVAGVMRANECTFGDTGRYLGNDDYMREYLSEWFEPSQIRTIECAFESDAGFRGHEASWDEAEDAADFGAKFKTDRARLIAIMENIIENDGTFSPPHSEHNED